MYDVKANQIKIFSKTSRNYNNLKKLLSTTNERFKLKLDSFFSQIENNFFLSSVIEL